MQGDSCALASMAKSFSGEGLQGERIMSIFGGILTLTTPRKFGLPNTVPHSVGDFK
jgi:hypothetical protein